MSPGPRPPLTVTMTLSPGLHAVPFFLGESPHFLGRDDALGFEADTDDNAVVVHPHHFTLHNFAPLISTGRQVLLGQICHS